jgi:hypothetical protein
MMCYHAKAFTTAGEQVEQARALLAFLADSCRDQHDPYSLLLAREADALGKQPDGYLYHEHLEDCNEPLYYHQFVARARRHGLAYLGDTDIRVMTPSNFPSEVAEVLRELAPDQIEAEQYMDFLRNRAFRQTLLCHEHQQPSYSLGPDRLARLSIAAPIVIASTATATAAAAAAAAATDLGSHAVESFQGRHGLTWKVTAPIVKAALRHLGASWPVAVPFADLVAEARSRVEAAAPAAPAPAAASITDAATLADWLLITYARAGHSGLELRRGSDHFVAKVASKPVASPLARLQAAAGNVVTSLRHESIVLGEFERQLLLLLDGENDKTELCNHLTKRIECGLLKVEQDGHRVRETGEVRRLVWRILDDQLVTLAHAALFVS